jgi:uncharacterized damage-inducible protein DinB
MTYYGSKELAASFRTVRKNTMQIAEEIPEDRYGYRATPESRSVGETLVHIAVTTRVPERIHFTDHLSTLVGFDYFGMVDALQAEVKKPRSKAEILDLLRAEGEHYAELLEGVSEAFLAERIDYPAGMVPPSKSRFEMVIAAKEHEMHHRGQLMLIERMLGITPHLTRHMQERIAQMKASQAGG